MQHSSPGVGEDTQREEDKALVKRIVSGDERAFREMYRLYAPSILRRLVQWLGHVQQAEDCLQQVFLEAVRSLERFRGDGKLISWLNRIATHVVMDLFRQKKRIQSLMERITPASDVQDLEDSPPIPEALFLREEARELIRTVLEKLSAEKRTAILLCDMEGLPLEEAALSMGIPPGTVGSRLYHGRREFQKRLVAEIHRRGLAVEDFIRE